MRVAGTGPSRAQKARGIGCESARAATLLVLAIAASVRGQDHIQVKNVAAGAASFSHQGMSTTIQAADRTVINYDRFDVPVGADVRFVQPSATSRVLNRIVASSPSRIDGTLSANGVVYFLNPAGVLFGPGSVVNVGQIYAGAADMSDQHFLSGVDQFHSAAGSVVNQGNINGQAVHLFGQRVVNEGVVSTPPEGLVTMAAGDEIYLGKRDDRLLVQIASAAPETPPAAAVGRGGEAAAAAVENSGSVLAPQGEVAFAVGDLYSLAMLNTGTVKSGRIAIRGGRNGDVVVSGLIDASRREPGSQGGEVEVFGRNVVVRGAEIDASGDAGGGSVLIGGGVRGQGPQPTSSRTVVTADTTLRADAVSSGDGGTVVVWGDDATSYQGKISARGGAASGDGGFVEVSGKDRLVFRGQVDTTAPEGSAGTLLLDPQTLTITDTALGDQDGNVRVDAAADAAELLADFDDTGANTLSWTALDQLGATTDILVQATERITVEDVDRQSAVTSRDLVALSLTTGSLTLESTTGSVVFEDPGDVIRTEGGAVAILAAGDALVGGFDTTGAAGDRAGGDVRVEAGGRVDVRSITSGGDVDLSSEREMTIASVSTLGEQSFRAETVELGGRYETVAGSWRLDGEAILRESTTVVTGAGDIEFTKSIVGRGFLRLAALRLALDAGDVRLGSEGGLVGVSSLDVIGRDVSVSGAVTSLEQNYIATRTLRLGGEFATAGSRWRASGDVALTADTSITTAGGSIDFSGAIDGASRLTLDAGAGDVTLGAAVGFTAAPLELTAVGRVVTASGMQTTGEQRFVAPEGVTLRGDYRTGGGAWSASGSMTLAGDTSVATAGGAIDVAGAVAGGFDLNLAAAAGDVFLGGDIGVERLSVQGRDLRIPQVTTMGDQTYSASGTMTLGGDYFTHGGDWRADGPVVLSADTAVSSADGDIDFASTIAGAPGLPSQLALRAGVGDVTVAGDAGAEHALGAVEISGRDVTLASVFTTIEGGDPRTDGTQTYAAQGTLALNSEYVAFGDILLGTGADRAPGDVTRATIYKTTSGNLRLVSVAGDVTVGRNERLTVTSGGLTVEAEQGTARLGDVSVRDNLIVTARDIVLLTRAAGEVETIPNPGSDLIQRPTSESLVAENGLDIIAGGNIAFSRPALVQGSGPVPRFADRDGLLSGDFAGFDVVKVARPLRTSDFGGVGEVPPLDLSLETIRIVLPSIRTDSQGRPVSTETNVAAAIAAAVPEVRPDVSQDSTVASAIVEVLESIGINPRDPTMDEWLAETVGAVFRDHEFTGFKVATPRLPSRLTTATAAIVKSLDRERLQDSFGRVMEAYEAEFQAPTPEGFREFLLENRSRYPDAVRYLRQLETLFKNLGLLGLNVGELENAKRTLLRDLADLTRGVTSGFLSRVVTARELPQGDS